MIIADIDVLIDFLVASSRWQTRSRSTSKTEQLQTTAVTSVELLSGADDTKRGQAVRHLIGALDVLP